MKIFGTDGVRGLANQFPMDSETVMQLGRASACVFRNRGKGKHQVLIGKDTRLSCYMLEAALATGLTSMGVDVIFLGPIPTPGVAFMVRSMRADAGIMISASHNSYEDNGIKFFGPYGYKLEETIEAEIEKLLQPGHLDELRANPDFIGRAKRIDEAISRYCVFLKSRFSRECHFEEYKIVLDTANGATYRVAPLVYEEFGAEVDVIGATPNGTNINLNCGSTHTEPLQKRVLEVGADCGIAFDGDGDRVIMVDEKGKILDGDCLLAIICKYFQEEKKLRGDGIVGTSMSNLGLEKLLESWNLKLHRANVGDKYVLSMMRELGCNLGGEQSGHIISLDDNTSGDGIMASLLVMWIMKKQQKPLSELASIYHEYPQVLKNVKVTKKIPFDELKKTSVAVKQSNEELKGKGRLVLRYSGTENLARVMVEAESMDLCLSVADRLVQTLSEDLK